MSSEYRIQNSEFSRADHYRAGSRVSPALVPAQAPVFAEIKGVTAERTGVVVTEKLVPFWPEGTITWAGTLAEDELLDRFTGWPPSAAGPVNATWPFTLLPPMTSDLEKLIEPTQAGCAVGLTVSVAEVELAEEAVIVALVADETVDVETGNVPVVCPAGMMTDAGTLAAALLLARPTSTPFEGAAEASVTVPVAD
jgi:hypothetical protein